MKPKRYKPEFAVQAWVENRARAFVFPDLDTIAPAGIPGGGGGAFSIQIAASDGPDVEKEKADIIADPTDGGAAIQTAADILHEFGAAPNNGGRIVLGAGTFTIPTAGAVSLGANIDLEGVGPGITVLTSSVTTGTILSMGGNCQIRDISIDGGNGTSVGLVMGDLGSAERVHFFSLGTAIIPGDYTTITRCSVPFPGATPVSVFIDATDVWTNLVIAHNTICSSIALGASTNIYVGGNTLAAGVSADGGEGLAIVGNVAEGQVNEAPILIANSTDIVIADNNWLNPGGFDGITLDTCSKGVVEGNYLGESPDIGILLDTCTNLVVQSNYLEFPGVHGIQLVDSDDCTIQGNHVKAALTDNYRIAGDRNLVMGNHSIPTAGFSTADFGINIVSGNDNAVYANYLGDSSAYGTADSVDSGTGTQTTPAGGVIGGQFAF